jgi:hypothetical protein
VCRGHLLIDTVPVSNECSQDAEGKTWVFDVQEDSRNVKIKAKEQSTHARDSGVLLQPNHWSSELTLRVGEGESASVEKKGGKESTARVGGGGGASVEGGGMTVAAARG